MSTSGRFDDVNNEVQGVTSTERQQMLKYFFSFLKIGKILIILYILNFEASYQMTLNKCREQRREKGSKELTTAEFLPTAQQ